MAACRKRRGWPRTSLEWSCELCERRRGSPRCVQLLKAIEPVVDRLMKRYQAAQRALQSAQERDHEADVKSAREELDALILFKGDMGAFGRLYTFPSQIFDYGNTALEKRADFYKRPLPCWSSAASAKASIYPRSCLRITSSRIFASARCEQ